MTDNKALSEDDMKQTTWADMSNVPIVPIRSVCQNRNMGADVGIAASKVSTAVDDGEQVRKRAEILGIDSERFNEKIRALEYVGPEFIMEETERQYQDEFQSVRCPYEETGDKRKCWGCPVPGNVLARAIATMKRERGRDDEQE